MTSNRENLISIIIPVFNRKAVLLETIDSLVDQTFKNWEAIVVDDGSTDGTLDELYNFAKKDSRIRIFKRNRLPKGAPTCRNIGLEKCKGDLIIFLDSDDILANYCLDQRVRYMNENPVLDFAVFPILIFDKSPGDTLILWNIFTEENDLDRFVKHDIVWQTSSPIFRRNFILMLKWDESLISGQDWDYHVRALALKPKYIKVDTIPDCFIRRDNNNDRISNNYFDAKEIFNRMPSELKNIAILKSNNLWKKEYNDAIAVLYYYLSKELIINNKEFEFKLFKFYSPIFKNNLVNLKDFLITYIYLYGLKKYRNNEDKRKKIKKIMARVFPKFLRVKIFGDTKEKIKLEGEHLEGFVEKFYKKKLDAQRLTNN
jgi:glycosyltransferase involved in cell wall biosynthesis